jgi:hypothetical protein
MALLSEPAPAPERTTTTHASELPIRRLEERVERVERTVGATVDLLHNLLHPEKAKPGAPPAN